MGEAVPPPPGISRWVVPEPPVPQPCYTPSAYLLFAALAATAEAAGLPPAKCEVYKLHLGGGFGRRGATQDWVTQTVTIAKEFDLKDPEENLGARMLRQAAERTGDVVGLDTLAHVVNTMRDTLPSDPWHTFFRAPAWLDGLIARGALGQKTKAGSMFGDSTSQAMQSAEWLKAARCMPLTWPRADW